MNKNFLALFLLFAGLRSYAQIPTPAFGTIENSDLELKECDFEKDANSMVLFDKAYVYFDANFKMLMERHKRIKIFNDKGKDKANIRLEFFSGGRLEDIYNVQAQTINLTNGKQEIIKLDKKLIYRETVDKNRTALVFSLPNIKAGSVIEFKYVWGTQSFRNFPDWTFQSDVPVRYSELKTSVPDMLTYKAQYVLHGELAVNTRKEEPAFSGSGADLQTYNNVVQVRALSNIHSLRDEPYMSSRKSNEESITFYLTGIKPIGGFAETYAESWAKVGSILADDEDFGLQLRKKLAGEEEIIAKAKALKTEREKIAYIFNDVRDRMKWNSVNRWYTSDGTPKAWDNKTGNSTEINLALCHLLKQAGVNVYPMIVSTRENGIVNTAYPFLYQFNKTVAYVPVDSTRRYVLDATDKFQAYDQIPVDLLNSSGLYVDKENKRYDLLFLQDKKSAVKNTFIKAAITKDGGMEGNASVTNFGHHKYDLVKEFKTIGEEKYKSALGAAYGNMLISSMKIEGADVDSLPAMQSVDFKQNLNSDGDYIFFKANAFSPLNRNPFLNEERTTDIHFANLNYYTVTGVYTLPEGYKVEAVPKSVSMNMADQSITFRRIVAQQGNVINFRVVIDFKKPIYFKDSYPELREFYRKMYEMIDEQIVLKKI